MFPTLTTSRYRPVESFKTLLQLIGFGTDCPERRQNPQNRLRRTGLDERKIWQSPTADANSSLKKRLGKSARLKITDCIPTRYENSILHMILQPLTITEFPSF